MPSFRHRRTAQETELYYPALKPLLKKTTLSIFIFFSLALSVKSHNWGAGAGVMYNFQSESFGVGARATFLPDNTFSFTPQVSYYPSFNKVHEYYLGLGVEYKFFRTEKFNFYALGHGAYNSWLNYQASPMKNAKPNNWNLEGGLGISTTGQWRPFAEYRYNIRFRETHLRVGLLYIFGGGSHGGHCPAYLQ